MGETQDQLSDSSGVADATVVRIGLLHPKQALVDALDVLLAPQPDIDVVAAHTTIDWIRHAVAVGHVNLLLINIDDPTVDSSVIEALRASSPALGIVAITDADETTLFTAAVRAGVRGWIGRDASVAHLAEVIRGVHRGETWFPPAYTTKLLDSLLADERSRQHAWGALSTLSTRELEVLRCLMQGLTRQDIAERFVLSPNTVRTHVNNMLRKLRVHSTLAAVSLARQAGLGQSTNGQGSQA